MKQIINGEVDLDDLEEDPIYNLKALTKDNKEMQEEIDSWNNEVPEEIAAQEFIESMAITRRGD